MILLVTLQGPSSHAEVGKDMIFWRAMMFFVLKDSYFLSILNDRVAESTANDPHDFNFQVDDPS